MKNKYIKKIKDFGKSLLKWIFYFLLIIVIALTIRIFFVEIYKIPSSSMEPTLIPGDFIIVSKMTYGARLLKIRKFYKEGKIEYLRTWGWDHIKRGDVFVFNWPGYKDALKSANNIFGPVVVKRCFGFPGDTIEIHRKQIDPSTMMDFNKQLFPKDTSFHWTLENYGPLYVPKKGQKIVISPRTALVYRDIIGFENKEMSLTDTSLIIDNKSIKEYTFKNNYYFMLGDNFYGSEDSRYWGFVPEMNIIGKAKLVLLSIDSYSVDSKFKWNRLFKFIR